MRLLLLRLLQKHRKRFVSALSFFLLYYKWFLYAVFDLLINSPFLIIVNGQVLPSEGYASSCEILAMDSFKYISCRNMLAMDCLCFSLYWFNTAASCSISLSTREMSSIFSDFPVVRSVICFDRLRICLLICTYLKSTTIKTAITKINNSFIPDTSLLVI